MSGPPFRHVKAGDRDSAEEHNRLVDLVSNISASMRVNTFVGSQGVLTRKAPPDIVVSGHLFKIFSVHHIATAGGDGIYDCFEQKLLDAEWPDEDGDYKFDDKNAVEVEVLNLAEADSEAKYLSHLVENDLLMAYQMTDDEGTKRWIGVPFILGNADRNRLAYCRDDAGASTTIVCYLDVDDDTSTEITVNCNISGGGNLNTCLRRLEDGDPIIVTKIRGHWFAVEGFQGSEDCVCTPPP